MIDLHSHTYESDGTDSPGELVNAALAAGLTALAITDHDTFTGYEEAGPLAHQAGLDLICGIELSTRLTFPTDTRGRSAHLLAYFLHDAPKAEFTSWLTELQAGRRDRNLRLAARLQSLGLDVHREEAEALGRSLTGRPHFAKVLVQKGYARDIQDAFDRFLADSSPGYVERNDPDIHEAIQRVNDGGGVSVLAHPVRLSIRDAGREESVLGELKDHDLRGLEVFHSDHSPADVERYSAIAEHYGLAVTGGSDYHGENKPNIRLGGARVRPEILERLRAQFG